MLTHGPHGDGTRLEGDRRRSQGGGYNLDIKNPHIQADDLGDPQELLATLSATEAEVTDLPDQLKAILAEALLR